MAHRVESQETICVVIYSSTSFSMGKKREGRITERIVKWLLQSVPSDVIVLIRWVWCLPGYLSLRLTEMATSDGGLVVGELASLCPPPSWIGRRKSETGSVARRAEKAVDLLCTLVASMLPHCSSLPC